MKFGSKYTAYQELVRGPEPILHPRTGIKTGNEKELVAEFAKHEGENYVLDPRTGDPMIDPFTGRPLGLVANIHGGYCDTVEQQLEKGWTDEERELVENALLNSVKRTAGTVVWVIEDALVPEPLKNWAKLSATRKLALAAELDVLAEAVAWEEQNNGDIELIARLSKKLGERQDSAAAEESLTAA